ncbi:hypothetical protein BVRB_8g196320 isoform B [Beta vulgaris subsp. vulgaris]|nr:hypothetical protein BVRB_8g196320 isoform B [Beta vulgaris subsp. vulgaris]
MMLKAVKDAFNRHQIRHLLTARNSGKMDLISSLNFIGYSMLRFFRIRVEMML